MIQKLRATLDKYTVQDGKEIALTMSCVHNADNLVLLASIGAGQPVEIEATQEALPFEAE